jgi:hypothetical protein
VSLHVHHSLVFSDTAVWIRISRVGIQISAQDPQIARTRKPVFIPVGLVHDIFMQPNINNVICVVYDELQSNMKGVLLYVVHPSDAQLIRDDFRVAKQTTTTPKTLPSTYSSPFDNRYSNAIDIYATDERRPYTTMNTVPSKSPVITVRQGSPRRTIYKRTGDEDAIKSRDMTPTLAQIIRSTPSKGSQHSSRDDHSHRRRKSPRKSRRGPSPAQPVPQTGVVTQRRKYRSRSPEKQVKVTTVTKSNSQELTQEQIRQQQQQQQLLFQQQQQQLLYIQQQHMAAWQASQQMPLVPVGIYNR